MSWFRDLRTSASAFSASGPLCSSRGPPPPNHGGCPTECRRGGSERGRKWRLNLHGAHVIAGMQTQHRPMCRLALASQRGRPCRRIEERGLGIAAYADLCSQYIICLLRCGNPRIRMRALTGRRKSAQISGRRHLACGALCARCFEHGIPDTRALVRVLVLMACPPNRLWWSTIKQMPGPPKDEPWQTSSKRYTIETCRN